VVGNAFIVLAPMLVSVSSLTELGEAIGMTDKGLLKTGAARHATAECGVE